MSKQGLVVSEGALLRGKEVILRGLPSSGGQDLLGADGRSHFWDKLKLQ